MYKKFILSVLMIFSTSMVQANESVEDLTRLANQAIEWLEKAAEQGHAGAQEALDRFNEG